MKIKELDIDLLKPAIYNPRKIDTEQLNDLVRSLKQFGFVDPLVVRSEDNMIIGGHQRYEAAKLLKYKTVPVVQLDISENDAKVLNVALNKISGEWEEDKLTSLLAELKDMDDVDELLTGFDKDEIDDLLADLEPVEGLTDEDAIPENVDPVCKKGQLWKLGDHRLLCGDSTKAEDLQILMDGKRAHMVFTDPPYGLGYEYNTYVDVQGDEYLEFCDKWFPLLKEHTDFIFLTAGWKYNTYWIKKDPTDIFYWIARNKQSGGKLSHFRKIEPIFLFGKPEEKYNFDFFEFNNEYHSADGSEKHACPKPVEFVAEATKIIGRNKIVLDAFEGSGTTIIACEKNRNKCYGMELDPLYCDVIIKRWEDFTGQKAELLK